MPEYQKNKKQNVPDTLYHYTSLKGLKGIITERQLRASDLRFLNDSSEFMYAFNLAESEITWGPAARALGGLPPCKTEKRDKVLIELLELILKESGQINEEVRTYSVSFTKQGDILSQWRAYCPRGGVSIGFEGPKLNEIIKKNYELQIVECEYDKEHQLNLLNKIFDDFKIHFKEEFEILKKYSCEEDINDFDFIQQKFISMKEHLLVRIAELSHTFKDPAFKEEEEWRLSVLGRTSDFKNEDFFLKESYFVPFVNISIEDENQKLPIKNIFIAPTSHKDLTKNSVKRLVNSMGIECPIADSIIPYRT